MSGLAFAAASGLAFGIIGGLPLDDGFVSRAPFAPPAARAAGVLWWIAFAWFASVLVNAVLDRVFFKGDGQPRARKLLSDLTTAVILFAAFLAVVALVFDQPVSALLATSGVVAVVMGLALQNTLGDLFSGLALNIERPYRAGDWVSLGDLHGVVMETNWRATHIRTRTRDIVVLPNTAMAKAQFVNHYRPTKVHALKLDVFVDDRTPPDRAIAILRQAAVSVPGVLADPAPIILVNDIRNGLIHIELYPFIADYAVMPLIRTEVFCRVWRHLNWAGVPIGRSRYDVQLNEAPPPHEPEERRRLAELLGRTFPFVVLSDAERLQLAGGLRRMTLASGVELMREGDAGDSMYLVAEGTLVVRPKDGAESRLGPGDHVGELALLTGEPRRATVTSDGAAVVYAVERPALEPILATRPSLAADLGRLLAERAPAPEPAGAEAAPAPAPARFAIWIRSTFNLG